MNWYDEIKHAVTNPLELLDILQLNNFPEQVESCSFPLFVPRGFIERMKKGDAKDPLLLQALPQKKEQQKAPGFNNDPLEEINANPVPGVLHKYFGRVLITVSNSCAVNCRFCFRRHYKFSANLLSQSNAKNILNYLANNTTIKEVILSGGEPLFICDQRMAYIYREIEKIAHIKTIRIHSRMPIVIPCRITDKLIKIFSNSKLITVLVTHCNHANEINDEVMLGLEKLRSSKVILLNQSVLLKNINNNVATLKMLSEKLFQAGVIPYYLHMLDKVAGAEHFAVSEQVAIDLIRSLEKELPGYLVPRLVKEECGVLAKTRIL